MNVLVIGANAELAESIVTDFEGSQVFLLGRSMPKYASNFSNVFFLQHSYEDSPDLSKFLESNGELCVIFLGIGAEPRLLINETRENLEKVISNHIGFAIDVISQTLPKMIENNFGRVIFLGSKISAQGSVGGGAYEIIKSSQKGLSRTISVEYARFGVTSNVIDVGYLENGYSERLNKSQREKLRRRIPTDSSINPNEISSIIKMLIETKSVSGSVITIDQAMN